MIAAEGRLFETDIRVQPTSWNARETLPPLALHLESGSARMTVYITREEAVELAGRLQEAADA